MDAFAVLIPSRLRADILAKTLTRMPFLDARHVVIGVEDTEYAKYRRKLAEVSHLRFNLIAYANPLGSVGVAREQLRQHALSYFPKVLQFVLTDDNARYTEESLHNLVQSAYDWNGVHFDTSFMAGMHSTAPHFDRGAIAKTKETLNGLTSYATVAAIYHTVHRHWYQTYQYPERCFALEDRHMFLTGIQRGMRPHQFRVCMDAPFSKSRYQPGGQGTIHERMKKCGHSIEQLAHDFPEYVGARGTFPTPWKFIMDMAAGASADRLVGGAMRKGENIVTIANPERLRLTARTNRRRG